jgi:TonB family protein
MTRCLPLAAAAALLVAPVAHAREWGEAGGWNIGESGDGESCGAMMEYEGKGETNLIFLHYVNGRIVLGATNTGWSADKEKEYDLVYVLNGKTYSGGKSFGLGERYEIRKGFVTGMEPSFEADFATGSSLQIYLGGTLVDNLSLSGTGAAVARVRQCVAHLRGIKQAAERERQRWAHIPDDPFKPAPPATPAPGQAATSGTLAQPAKFLFGTITDYDYPAEAQRKGMAGTVGITLIVEPDARISKCTITASSGHDLLDEETCKIAARRFHFAAAKDESGNPIRGSFSRTITWRLPPPEPPPPPPLVIERPDTPRED